MQKFGVCVCRILGGFVCFFFFGGGFSSFVQTSRVKNKVKIEGAKESQQET